MALTPITIEEESADPAPSVEQRNGNRSEQFVREISTHANLELKKMRDEIDDLIRTINEKQDALIDQINEHIKFATAAIKAKVIISQGIESVQKAFEPTPPVRSVQSRTNGNGH